MYIYTYIHTYMYIYIQIMIFQENNDYFLKPRNLGWMTLWQWNTIILKSEYDSNYYRLKDGKKSGNSHRMGILVSTRAGSSPMIWGSLPQCKQCTYHCTLLPSQDSSFLQDNQHPNRNPDLVGDLLEALHSDWWMRFYKCTYVYPYVFISVWLLKPVYENLLKPHSSWWNKNTDSPISIDGFDYMEIPWISTMINGNWS